MLVSNASVSTFSSINADASREPLFRGEELDDTSAFLREVLLLTFDFPPDRLVVREDAVAGGGVVTMKPRSVSPPCCDAVGLGRTVLC